jgi:hypothetical protein
MGAPHTYYSVYNRRTDQPVIIHGMARDCAKAMGVTPATFYHYITRNRTGFLPCKYEIVTDEPEEDEDG